MKSESFASSCFQRFRFELAELKPGSFAVIAFKICFSIYIEREVPPQNAMSEISFEGEEIN